MKKFKKIASIITVVAVGCALLSTVAVGAESAHSRMYNSGSNMDVASQYYNQQLARRAAARKDISVPAINKVDVAAPAVVEEPKKDVLNLIPVTLDEVDPIDKDDKIMMPARFVAENLGAEVLWDAESQTVTMKDDKVEVKLVINSNIAYVNGVAETLTTPAYVEDGRTYAPVYYVAEKFGADVEWDNIFKVYRIIKK